MPAINSFLVLIGILLICHSTLLRAAQSYEKESEESERDRLKNPVEPDELRCPAPDRGRKRSNHLRQSLGSRGNP